MRRLPMLLLAACGGAPDGDSPPRPPLGDTQVDLDSAPPGVDSEPSITDSEPSNTETGGDGGGGDTDPPHPGWALGDPIETLGVTALLQGQSHKSPTGNSMELVSAVDIDDDLAAVAGRGGLLIIQRSDASIVGWLQTPDTYRMAYDEQSEVLWMTSRDNKYLYRVSLADPTAPRRRACLRSHRKTSASRSPRKTWAAWRWLSFFGSRASRSAWARLMTLSQIVFSKSLLTNRSISLRDQRIAAWA